MWCLWSDIFSEWVRSCGVWQLAYIWVWYYDVLFLQLCYRNFWNKKNLTYQKWKILFHRTESVLLFYFHCGKSRDLFSVSFSWPGFTTTLPCATPLLAGFTTTLPCAIPLLVANCSCHCMKVGCTSGLWWPCIVFKSQNNWKYIFVHIFSLRTDQGNEHCQTTTSHRWWSSFHHLCVIRL